MPARANPHASLPNSMRSPSRPSFRRLPGLARRRRRRPHRARRVLPGARCAGRLRTHQGALHRRPLSRAFARLLFRERRPAARSTARSADWMDRNLFRRIEVAFPVESPELRARVADDLNLYLADDVQAWELAFERSILARRGRRQRVGSGATLEPVRRARRRSRSLEHRLRGDAAQGFRRKPASLR